MIHRALRSSPFLSIILRNIMLHEKLMPALSQYFYIYIKRHFLFQFSFHFLYRRIISILSQYFIVASASVISASASIFATAAARALLSAAFSRFVCSSSMSSYYPHHICSRTYSGNQLVGNLCRRVCRSRCMVTHWRTFRNQDRSFCPSYLGTNLALGLVEDPCFH